MHDDGLPNNKHISPAKLAALHNGAWGWAMSIVGVDKPAAEDILQQVYLMIVEGRARYDGKSTLKTWLYGVIRNVGYRHYRRLRKDHLKLAVFAAEQRLNGIGSIDATQQSELENTQRQALVIEAMKRLPARQQQVLELTVYREFTLAQCASILGIRIGSVRTHYHRGKAALRQSLGASVE